MGRRRDVSRETGVECVRVDLNHCALSQGCRVGLSGLEPLTFPIAIGTLYPKGVEWA